MDENKIIARESGGSAVELVSMPHRFSTIDLSPREPHLYDYLLILRKHQWLILSFMLAVVTIVSIATFRMQPVYVANAKIEIDRENTSVLPFPGADSYDYMVDFDNFVETQARILTSETLALQTIRNNGLFGSPVFSNGDAPSEAIATGSLANQPRPPEIAAFLSGLACPGNVSASTQNQALSAILFLYEHVLEQPLDRIEGVVRARRRDAVPKIRPFDHRPAQRRPRLRPSPRAWCRRHPAAAES
jgi:hypothetical protein